MTETPNKRYETDRGGDAEVEAADKERQHAACDGKRYSGQHQQAVEQRIEQAVEHRHDQNETDRYDDLQPLCCLLKFLELAGPFDPISDRQLHILRDTPLRFGDGASEVASPNTELDGDKALIAFVIDIGCARIERYVGEFAQRNIGISAARLIADLDIAHRVDAVAKFGRQANGQVELPVALQDRRRCRAAQGGLHHGVQISGV